MLDPSPILQTAFAFWNSKVLLTAVQFGVFTTLGARHLTGSALGAELGLHPRAISDFFDALVMRPDEFQVSQQRAEVFPAGKRFCAYQYAVKLPVLLQIRIDMARQRGEVCCFKWSFGMQHQYSVVVSQVVVEHGIFSIGHSRQWRE